MKIHHLFLFVPLFFFSQHIQAQANLTSYVDPFIGTGGHGHTFPGAVVPFGMVQLSPDNGKDGWDWSSGYHYDDDENVIAGFSHMHLSGTGIGDWLDISVMPLVSPLSGDEELIPATFNHQNEKASPGYYSVQLDNDIGIELTTTERVGYHRYHFPKDSRPTIRFDLSFHHNWDVPTETFIKKVNDSTIVGYRYSTGWAQTQRVYFAAQTSKPIGDFTLKSDLQIETGAIDVGLTTKEKGKGVTAQLIFGQTSVGETIEMKVALSMTSTEKALIALQELPGWNFMAVKEQADTKWETELEKIRIQTKDEKLKQIFYTALYHTAISPATYSDADGEYKNWKGEIHKMHNGATRYTLYSLWDTFRALNPLFTLTQPERYTDILNSMLTFYDENGLLPVWDLSTWETNTMTGYHAIPVLADAVLKNWPGLDKNKAYEAMKKSAFQKGRGVPLYVQYGFVPQDKMGHSATMTLEYAYDDWCIAQVAKKMGKMDDYALFCKRAQSYRHLFDPVTGFMRAKNSDGIWAEPFDPYFSEHDPKKAQYTEGNAWQHSFFVPHDVRGLADLYGKDGLEQKLDSLFTVSSVVKGENSSPDISGMIGQYAHGNEPSHHIAYLYAFIGKAWKTQQRVRQIVDSMYHANPDGYAGNEDAGQMSAWAVWSIMGLYPANPAGGEYVIGSPAVDEVSFQLEGGKEFSIKAQNNSPENKYIQSATFNGKPYERTYMNHEDLLKGGELVFQMGSEPNEDWGKEEESWPKSMSSLNPDLHTKSPENKRSLIEWIKDLFKNI